MHGCVLGSQSKLMLIGLHISDNIIYACTEYLGTVNLTIFYSVAGSILDVRDDFSINIKRSLHLVYWFIPIA